MKPFPQNLDMERAVLGAILSDEDTSVALLPELQPDDFYLPSHQRLFSIAYEFFLAGVGIDILTMEAELKRRGETKLTASDLVSMVGDSVPTVAVGYVDTLRKLSRARALIRDCVATTEKLLDMADEPSTIGIEHAAEVLRICEDRVTGFEPIERPTQRTLIQIERSVDGTEYLGAVPSGLVALDTKIGGMQKGKLILIAGRPGMGKTSMALTISRNASLRGYPCAYVTAEDRSESLVIRLLSGFAAVENNLVRTGRLSESDIERIVAAASRVSSMPLSSMDKNRSWDAIKAAARTLKMRQPTLSMIAVDHVQLLRAPTREAKRYLEVGRISSEAKELGIELNIAFVLLCQLNRAVEQRDDKRPMLSDLRESGDLEQDADFVLFPFRPAYYDRDFQPRDMMEVDVAKNRDGPTGYLELAYNERLTLVEDREVVTTQTEGEQR